MKLTLGTVLPIPQGDSFVYHQLDFTGQAGSISTGCFNFLSTDLDLGMVKPIDPEGGYFTPPHLMGNRAKRSLTLKSCCLDFLTFPKYLLGPHSDIKKIANIFS